MLLAGRELALFRSHLPPDDFEIFLEPRIAGILMQGARKPAVRSGQVASGAVAGCIHRTEKRVRLCAAALSGTRQAALRAITILRHAVAVEIAFAFNGEAAAKEAA